MGQLFDLYGTVRVDGASVEGALARINQQVAATQGNMGRLESSLVSWGKSFVGIAAVAGTMRMGLGKIAEDERAMTRLSGVLRATGNVAGLSAQELNVYARSLKDLTGICDAETTSAMALLATHRLSSPVFNEAIRLAQDTSILYGDLGTAAAMLGKALEDPAEGVALLERLMKSRLSPAMKDQIAQFVTLGDTAKAQAVILDFVRSKVGGLAEAAGKDAAGQIAKLQRAWEDFAASAAKPVTLLINVAAQPLRVLEAVQEAIDEMITPGAGETPGLLSKAPTGEIYPGFGGAKTLEEWNAIHAGQGFGGGIVTGTKRPPTMAEQNAAALEAFEAKQFQEQFMSPEYAKAQHEADAWAAQIEKDRQQKAEAAEELADRQWQIAQDEADENEARWRREEEMMDEEDQRREDAAREAANLAYEVEIERQMKGGEAIYGDYGKKPRAAEMTLSSLESYVADLQRSIGREKDQVPDKIDTTNRTLSAIHETLKLGQAVTS